MRKVLSGAVLLVALVAIVALMGCGPKDAQVEITKTGFTPATVTVKTGATVTWTNADASDHTVTFGRIDSRGMKKGDTFSQTFDEPGTYPYGCRYNPKLTGTVVVE